MGWASISRHQNRCMELYTLSAMTEGKESHILTMKRLYFSISCNIVVCRLLTYGVAKSTEVDRKYVLSMAYLAQLFVSSSRLK